MSEYTTDGFQATPYLSDERKTSFSAAPELGEAIEPGKQYRAVLETSKGRIVVELFPDEAPETVNSFAYLLRHHYYDGIKFHRVIDGFMAQTGDPTGTGMGGSKLPDIKAEFSKEPFQRGTVGMARSSDPDSGNSQFFIMFADGDFLNGQYTVWGKVDEAGMACVDKIERGEPPANPDKMVKVTVE